MPDMQTSLCGIPLKNPVIAASGTYGFGREFEQFYPIGLLGGISVKGLTLRARKGNAAPRIAETPSGMLNSVGLQNPGIDAFLGYELPWLLDQGTVVIANIAGNTEEEYCAMMGKISLTPVHMVELNISCPNVKQGGLAFGTKPESIEAITRAVRASGKKPLMVKLSPNVADIAECALAAQQGGADAVSLINTLTGMAVDVRTRKPLLGNVVGGLSGPAIKPVALRMVWQAARAVRIPVVGMGGIMTGEDVAAFLLCGAQAVQVGTANIADPLAIPRILEELNSLMVAQGIDSVEEFIGGLQVE